ncbi:MAG TPA: thioesterase family protein [Bacteroidales bacterium]|nr:thioesterase family protein [Bacteroidales bacterium]
MTTDIIIPLGLRGKMELTVEPEQTATHYGSGLVEVFATPAMVAFMENTALCSLNDILPSHLTTVGASINIRHLKATPIGRKLRCESRVIEVNGRKIVFDVSVWEGEMLAGHGTHVRYIVDIQQFMSQFQNS